MNKTAIKNFAVRARNRLIEDITQKAYELGITKGEIKEIETFEGGFKIKDFENSKTYKKYEIKQREKLVSNIKEKGFDQTIEEVAYTWFNRFVALRFMEVNEYLPAGVRVLSSLEQGKTEPDIIKEALNIDFDLNPKEYEEYKEIVYRLMDANDTEDLYRYLIVKQCNQLGSIMPMVFEEISDYTELLLPNNLLAEDSIVRDLVESIEEEDYKDQVEIMGWMYQYYNQEKRDEIFDSNMSNKKKLVKNDIPAATQIFTPKWIVEFIVQNSLGRLWQENLRDDELISKWRFYLENDDLRSLCNNNSNNYIDPKDIKVIDPSMGSGHVLVYCFDILYDIYIRVGYSEREIPKLILENNLYGLEIDDRAAQLATFSLCMKARSKSRRIFRNPIKLNVCSIQESNYISKECVEYFINDNDNIRSSIEYLINLFDNAKVYGSILEIDIVKLKLTLLEERLSEIKNAEIKNLFQYQYKDEVLGKIEPLIKQAKIMMQKYHITVTNPPYMGNRRMVDALKRYANKKYPDVKTDLFSMFIKKCTLYTRNDGFIGLVTPYVWWFISSFEKLRKYILNNATITSLIQLEYNAFEGATIPVGTFVLRNRKINAKGEYIKLSDFKGIKNQPIKTLEAIENPSVYYRYSQEQDSFSKIPGMPIAYWVSENIKNVFMFNKNISDEFIPKFGMSTGDGNQYIRNWYEVNCNNVCFNAVSEDEFNERKVKWNVIDKGGEFRRWYGNKNYIVNWENNGFEIKNNPKSAVRSPQYFFKPHISWTLINSSSFSVRFFSHGFILDTASNCIYFKDNTKRLYVLALLNSNVAQELLDIMNPTLNFSCGIIGLLPFLENKSYYDKIENLVKHNLVISQDDWDSFETSWDFKHHPLLTYASIKNNFDVDRIEIAFKKWSDFTNEQFARLKANEEELNRIFIDIYGLQDELTPEVDDKDITIARVYNSKQDIPESMKGNNYILTREDVIKSFISYAVGCMFGRYSLDEEGLIYAGGEFDEKWKVEGGKWKLKKNSNEDEPSDIWIDSSFDIVKDNVLVIADDDYFEDDIVNRFVNFVKVTFGEKTLEENLDYIAETLGQKASETSRQTIGRYFLKNFYKDHIKTYQKRPIYWLFDSGKKNGFKALIYMHRYDSSTVARVRTDYLHKLQKMYEAEVKRLDILLESDLSAREKAAAKKKKDSINKQIQECMTYDQVVAHIANQKIEIDLDDGVKVNYAKFQGVEVPQGEGKKPLKANLLAKI